MKLMRIRKVVSELVIGVPRKLVERLSAEYVTVSMNEAGREGMMQGIKAKFQYLEVHKC